MRFLVAIIALIAIAQAQDARRQQYEAISTASRRELGDFVRATGRNSAIWGNRYFNGDGAKVSDVQRLPQSQRNHLFRRNYFGGRKGGRGKFRSANRDDADMDRENDRKSLQMDAGDRKAIRARFMRNSIGFAGVRGQAPMSFEQRLASARGARMEREIIRAEADIPN